MAESALTVKDIWESVSPEERQALFKRSQASGHIAGVTILFLVTAIAIGFEEPWLILAGLLSSYLVVPFAAGHKWRKFKPQIILAYLAVRTVARRYGLANRFKQLDSILTFRSTLKHTTRMRIERNEELPEWEDEVWVSLLNGGLIIISEQPGGAKLELASAIAPEIECRLEEAETDYGLTRVFLSNIDNSNKGKVMILSSYHSTPLKIFVKTLKNLTMRETENMHEEVGRMLGEAERMQEEARSILEEADRLVEDGRTMRAERLQVEASQLLLESKKKQEEAEDLQETLPLLM